VIAPVTQKLIQSFGWMSAMWTMSILALAALPLVGKLTDHTTTAHKSPDTNGGLRQALRDSLKSPSYGLLHAGFFTCGFHIAFLVTHLPGEVDLCGLPASVASWSLAIIGLANIAGSLYVGSCINRFRSKYILCAMYGSRALLVIWYLLVPKEAWVFYIFAAGLGFTWLATVPPTAALVGKLFGARYLATLFGLTLLSHQIGGFLGAWLGGLAIANYGDLTLMWYADIALAVFAALVNLPIQEAPITPVVQATN
jgi:predicted MFS family arabinose efflux permease